MVISPGFHPGEYRFEPGTPYMPLIKGFDLTTTMSNGPDRYHVSFYRQPLHRWLAAKLYHRYDSIIWRVPGVRALERLLKYFHRYEEWYIPLTNQQDLRCYDLHLKDKQILETIEISKDLYDLLK